MQIEIGFSYVGLIYLLMLFVPNIIWSRNKPKGYDPSIENKALVILERIGQIGCTCGALLTDAYNPQRWEPWTLWLVASFCLMLLYEVCWIRYFKSERTQKDFYQSFWGIPVPLASLPVTAFLLLGIYGRVIWLVVSSVVLGVGHIGIHLQHLRRTR